MYLPTYSIIILVKLPLSLYDIGHSIANDIIRIIRLLKSFKLFKPFEFENKREVISKCRVVSFLPIHISLLHVTSSESILYKLRKNTQFRLANWIINLSSLTNITSLYSKIRIDALSVVLVLNWLLLSLK